MSAEEFKALPEAEQYKVAEAFYEAYKERRDKGETVQMPLLMYAYGFADGYLFRRHDANADRMQNDFRNYLAMVLHPTNMERLPEVVISKARSLYDTHFKED